MRKYYGKAQSQRVANPDKHVVTSMEAQLSEPFLHPSQHRNLTSTWGKRANIAGTSMTLAAKQNEDWQMQARE